MKYRLCSGTQVREEDFGLLFYTMAGPRLYFLSSGDLVDCDFFLGASTLEGWLEKKFDRDSLSESRISELGTSLNRLMKEGVIVEC